ncbi:septum formation family protein [Gordonia jacobaea]|uniref:septum formation family protein n=1 Tax=Gordonia TaxID=2053 RepID=UPI003B849FBE
MPMNDDPDKVSDDETPDPSATDHVEPVTEQFEPVTEEFEPIGAEEGVEAGAEESDEPETERPVVDDEAATAEPARRRGVSGVLAANPMRVVLAAIVIGAIVAGGIAFALGSFTDNGNVGSTDIGENERLTQNAFTRSVAGDCLDWPDGQPGQPSKVACDQLHRFEVAGPLNTALLPGSEFGDSAAWPGAERFAAIRDEQCPVIVDDYLQGKLDPQGRFSVGMMYPSQAQWDKGARELRCGLQQTGKGGQPDQVAGRVIDNDQSFSWPPGTCIGIDQQTRRPTVPATVVGCSEPHAFQTTGIVDLSARFGNRTSGKPWPQIDDQNKFLAGICPAQAQRFLGGKEKLDATTLNTQWSVISEPSWLAGSRKVVCYIGLPDRGGFATLVGDARQTLLINGKLPAPPPQAPPGRVLPTPVPLPPGIQPNPEEVPAPAG